VRAKAGLPPLSDNATVRVLADEMLAQKQIAALSSSTHAALAFAAGLRDLDNSGEVIVRKSLEIQSINQAARCVERDFGRMAALALSTILALGSNACKSDSEGHSWLETVRERRKK
jgi:hypothetical protein